MKKQNSKNNDSQHQIDQKDQHRYAWPYRLKQLPNQPGQQHTPGAGADKKPTRYPAGDGHTTLSLLSMMVRGLKRMAIGMATSRPKVSAAQKVEVR